VKKKGNLEYRVTGEAGGENRKRKTLRGKKSVKERNRRQSTRRNQKRAGTPSSLTGEGKGGRVASSVDEKNP